MTQKFKDATTARKYVNDFKHILGRDVSFVETSMHRTIHFDTMTDEDAIWVAEQLREIELEAAQRSRGRRGAN
jgi:hypothetical protein